jgi:hypothetical protein
MDMGVLGQLGNGNAPGGDRRESKSGGDKGDQYDDGPETAPAQHCPVSMMALISTGGAKTTSAKFVAKIQVVFMAGYSVQSPSTATT